MSRIAQQIGRQVELYYRQIVFPVAKNHWVLIEMTPHPRGADQGEKSSHMIRNRGAIRMVMINTIFYAHPL